MIILFQEGFLEYCDWLDENDVDASEADEGVDNIDDIADDLMMLMRQHCTCSRHKQAYGVQPATHTAMMITIETASRFS